MDAAPYQHPAPGTKFRGLPFPTATPGPVPPRQDEDPVRIEAEKRVANLVRANGGPSREPGNWSTDVTVPTVQQVTVPGPGRSW